MREVRNERELLEVIGSYRNPAMCYNSTLNPKGWYKKRRKMREVRNERELLEVIGSHRNPAMCYSPILNPEGVK